MRPIYYECGTCGNFHPLDWYGDCRDDSMRFTFHDLDELYGENGWDYSDPGTMSSFEYYGYGVSDTGDGLELQRCDAVAKFVDDTSAAVRCHLDTVAGNLYAINCILALTQDYVERGGIGRTPGHMLNEERPQPNTHDMDAWQLWGALP
jgi:hypothetical protein